MKYYLRIKARVSVLYGDLMHAGIWKNTREVPEARRGAEVFPGFTRCKSELGRGYTGRGHTRAKEAS